MISKTLFQKVFNDEVNPKVIRWFFRAFATGLAGLHVWAAITAQSMNADGISYLDIADAYFNADWANAINPVWSPLYSWILGFAYFVIQPSIEWEFPTVHFVNFLIFLATLASFEFMWQKVWTSHSQQADVSAYRLPNWLWWTLGYLLFIWISLSLIEIWSVTPDMLMAMLVFLAAGLLTKIRDGGKDLRIFLSLGLILGLGYLAKSFMFSVAFVFLGLSLVLQKRSWAALWKTAMAALLFVIISLPFILLISETKGKLTIGEAGTVTILRYVNGMPFPHWQGDPDNGIIPQHPSRVIHQSPIVYEFGSPVVGTYPISTDPSYWYEGIEPRLQFDGLLERLLANGMVYADLFFQKQGILFASVIALYVMGRWKKFTILEAVHRWALVIPAVISFGLYGVILVEGRYVGVFIVLFWADILANIRLSDTTSSRTWLKTMGSIASVGLLVSIIMFNLDGFTRLNPTMQVSSNESASLSARPLEVAIALQKLGIKQGDRVGVIGYAYDSFWARLTRVKIVAEMLEGDANKLWRGDEALQQSVLLAIAGTGAKAVVAEYVPDYARMNGWQQVGESNYYIYVFPEK